MVEAWSNSIKIDFTGQI